MKEFFLVKLKDVRLLILIILMAGLLNYGYESFEVEGDSMAETYSDGERFLVNKVAFRLLKPQVGDVIVFWSFLSFFN